MVTDFSISSDFPGAGDSTAMHCYDSEHKQLLVFVEREAIEGASYDPPLDEHRGLPRLSQSDRDRLVAANYDAFGRIADRVLSREKPVPFTNDRGTYQSIKITSADVASSGETFTSTRTLEDDI